MEAKLFITFTLVLPFLLVIALLIFNYRKNREYKCKLREIANQLGLEFYNVMRLSSSFEKTEEFKSKPSFFLNFIDAISAWDMRGEWKGQKVNIFLKVESAGKNTKYYTVFRHEFQPVFPFEMQLTRQSTLENFFVKLFHLQDIQIGNKQFDDTFRIQTNQKDINFLKSFLQNPTLQAGLIKFAQGSGDILVTHQIVEISINGKIADIKEFKENLDRIVEVVNLLKEVERF